MSHFSRIALALAAAAAAACLGVAPGGAANPRFEITYSGNTITVTADGTAIGFTGQTVVTPETYDVFVVDTTSPPAFQLNGPGVNLTVTQAPLQTTVTFQPNSTYVYEDGNDANATHRTFVTAGPTVNAPAPARTGAPVSYPDIVGSGIGPHVLGTVDGALTAAGRLAVTFRGKPLTKLSPGRYTLIVQDGSATAGLTLRQVGKQPVQVTAARFVGKHTVSVTLAAGRWSLSAPGSSTSFVVSA